MSDYQTEAEPKAWADGVPVFCAHDAIVDVAKLYRTQRTRTSTQTARSSYSAA